MTTRFRQEDSMANAIQRLFGYPGRRTNSKVQSYTHQAERSTESVVNLRSELAAVKAENAKLHAALSAMREANREKAKADQSQQPSILGDNLTRFASGITNKK